MIIKFCKGFPPYLESDNITKNFVKAGDLGLLSEEIASQKVKLGNLQGRVNHLEISNIQLNSIIDSLEKSIDDLTAQNLKQDILADRLVKFANKTKEQLSQRITAFDLKLDTHIDNHCQDAQKLLEEELAKIKDSIDSSGDPANWNGCLDPGIVGEAHGELSVQVCLYS